MDATGVMQLQQQSTTAIRWARQPTESLDDWILRLRAEAIDQLPFLDGAGEPVMAAYD